MTLVTGDIFVVSTLVQYILACYEEKRKKSTDTLTKDT